MLLFHSLLLSTPLTLASFPGIYLVAAFSVALLFFTPCPRSNLFAVHSQLVHLS